MRLNSSVFLLVAALLLAGCQTAVEPSVRGEWSQAVNGVRMKALPIAAGSFEANSRTILIFTQNVSDQDVNLPGIRPASFVTVKPNDEQLQPKGAAPDGNLRIDIEAADNESLHGGGAMHEIAPDVDMLNAPLHPGETRVFAVILKTDYSNLRMQQQIRDNEVRSGMSQWLIHSPKPRLYRVTLTYRPSGFEPSGGDSGRILREVSHANWQGIQIELPPIEMMVSSTDRNSL